MKIVLSNSYGPGFDLYTGPAKSAITALAEERVCEDTSVFSKTQKEFDKAIGDMAETIRREKTLDEWRSDEMVVKEALFYPADYRVFEVPDNATDHLVVEFDGRETAYVVIDGKIRKETDIEKERQIKKDSQLKKETRGLGD